MNEFLNIALSFPTLPWSVLLAFCLIYWLMAATGIVDLADGWIDPDLGDVVDAHAADHGHASSTGMMARLGLSGIPFMLVLVVIAFVGWTATYYAHLWLLSGLNGPMRWLLGAGTCIGALMFATIIAGFVLRPVRKLILKLRTPPSEVTLLGRVGTILSATADDTQGRAEFDDGGAGLILQVRAPQGQVYPRGAKVVLIGIDAEQDTHQIMLQTDFIQQ